MEKIGSAKVNGKVSYGFGIVGCGMISAVHADVIKALPNAHLVGVCDHSLARATAFAEKHGGRAFADADALYAAEGIDVIVICTPSGTHTELTVAALRTGHHVLIEKPLALTLEGIEAIGRAKEESGRTVAVVSQQRFSPAFCKIHSLIAEGALGDLLLADLAMPYHRDPAYYEAVAWRGTKAMDGGELFNQGVHGVDLMMHLCGGVRAVTGATRTLVHSIEAEDTTVATLEFENGAIGTLRSTTAINPGYPRRFTLHFTKGTIALDDDHIAVWDIPDVARPEITVDTSRQAHRDPMAFSIDYHLAETADLLAAIDEGREPLISFDEGRRAPAVIIAIYRAAEEGRRITV